LNGRAVYRRSGNAGQSWSSPVAFSGGSAPPTGSPVVVFRSSAWRVAFERCTDNECFESQVYYRQSASGSSWGAATKVTNVMTIRNTGHRCAHPGGTGSWRVSRRK